MRKPASRVWYVIRDRDDGELGKYYLSSFPQLSFPRSQTLHERFSFTSLLRFCLCRFILPFVATPLLVSFPTCLSPFFFDYVVISARSDQDRVDVGGHQGRRAAGERGYQVQPHPALLVRSGLNLTLPAIKSLQSYGMLIVYCVHVCMCLLVCANVIPMF